MARRPRRRRRQPLQRTALAALAGTLVFLGAVRARAETPTLTALPHQERRAAEPQIGPLKLWDTTWWIDVVARASESVPLEQIEYRARFADGTDPRNQSGSWPVGAAEVSGRVAVVCPARPDYERRLRVELRARDRSGAVSDWRSIEFPPNGDTVEGSPIALSTKPDPPPHQEAIGPVEIEASNDMTIADVRAALQRKAVERGASAALNLRLVRSDARSIVFAADLVRDLQATPPPTARKPSDTIAGGLLGEIRMPLARR